MLTTPTNPKETQQQLKLGFGRLYWAIFLSIAVCVALLATQLETILDIKNQLYPIEHPTEGEPLRLFGVLRTEGITHGATPDCYSHTKYQPDPNEVTEGYLIETSDGRRIPLVIKGSSNCAWVGEPLIAQGCFISGRLGDCSTENLFLTRLKIKEPIFVWLVETSLYWLFIVGFLGAFFLWFGALNADKSVTNILDKHGAIQKNTTPDVFDRISSWADRHLGLSVPLFVLSFFALLGGALWLALLQMWNVFAVLSCLMGLKMLISTARQWSSLSAASATVKKVPTSLLAQSLQTSQLVELVVKASEDQTTGPLSSKARAWWSLNIRQVGPKQSTDILTKTSSPLVKVEDNSGHGVLDLTHASIDVPGLTDRLPPALPDQDRKTLFLDGVYFRPDFDLLLDERYINKGDTLYIFGQVSATTPSGEDQEYRTSSLIPTISGTKEQPLLVYTGTEKTLLRALRLEQTTLSVYLVALALLELVQVALTAWYLSL